MSPPPLVSSPVVVHPHDPRGSARHLISGALLLLLIVAVACVVLSTPTKIQTPLEGSEPQQQQGEDSSSFSDSSTLLSSNRSSRSSGGKPNKNSRYKLDGLPVLQLLWDAGLNNLRGYMLQTLVLAKAWGFRRVRLGSACLKLRNMQFEMTPNHVYKPPYDWVRLKEFPRHRSMPKLRLTQACSPRMFQELFDVDFFKTTLWEKFEIEVIDNDDVDDNNNNGKEAPPPLLLPDFLIEDKRFATWSEVLAAKPLGADRGLLVSENPAAKHTSQQIKRQLNHNKNFAGALYGTTERMRLLLKIQKCETEIASCSDLSTVFRPSETVVKLFSSKILDAIRSASGSSSSDATTDFTVLHYRGFNCIRAQDPRAKKKIPPPDIGMTMYRFIDSQLEAGTLKKRPRVLYVSTGIDQKLFIPSMQRNNAHNYTVLTKLLVNPEWTTTNYPFEVMAMVDYAVAREATDILSLTGGGKGRPGGSSWAAFLDVERQRSSGSPKSRVIYSSQECST